MLAAVKQYLRIDDAGEDQTLIDNELITLIAAAESYLKNAGVKIELISDQELYKMALFLLVAHWYENREPIGEAQKMAYSLDAILTQLIYCADSII